LVIIVFIISINTNFIRYFMKNYIFLVNYNLIKHKVVVSKSNLRYSLWLEKLTVKSMNINMWLK